ncbi:BON domain-containing protein [Rugamonas sp.]|uniref:BON domain-containing protein n=1 Tax=Rugamonas sp. TaxID=1926287 RepID=UPI0025F19853|nr:BON domain-containing protein [Rugamonas sp.]
MNRLMMLALATAMSGAAYAAPTDSAAYKAATAKADSDYQAASAQCDGQSGNAQTICMQEAKAARARSNADAVAQYKNTKKATEKAQIAVADADYNLARAKCADQAGGAKDSCINDAKAAKNAAVTEAKSDYRTAENNTDCSALSGADKASCMTHTKSAAAGAVVADSVITTKVKADLLKEPDLKSLDVHVDTANGVVTLSGFVASQAEADRAAQLARGVKGVSDVQNTLQVK